MSNTASDGRRWHERWGWCPVCGKTSRTNSPCIVPPLPSARARLQAVVDRVASRSQSTADGYFVTPTGEIMDAGHEGGEI